MLLIPSSRNHLNICSVPGNQQQEEQFTKLLAVDNRAGNLCIICVTVCVPRFPHVVHMVKKSLFERFEDRFDNSIYFLILLPQEINLIDRMQNRCVMFVSKVTADLG